MPNGCGEQTSKFAHESWTEYFVCYQPDGTDCTATVSDMLECEAKAHEAFSKGKRKSASVLPDDFMFENEDGGFLDTDNYRKRVLHKVARELQLPKLTFQVIRRTIATLAQKKGTIKDVQGVMRHSRTALTTDVYMQEIPASVQSTINSINSELRKSDGRNRRKPQKSVRTDAVGISRRKPSARVT